MFWQLWFKICLVLLACGLTGCSSAPHKSAKAVSLTSVQASDEPCWVRTPDCRSSVSATALYFVGQSKAPIANWGSPGRESLQSAQRDAEHSYARFLGVEIESSSYIQSIFEKFSPIKYRIIIFFWVFFVVFFPIKVFESEWPASTHNFRPTTAMAVHIAIQRNWCR